jgi:hypothetical protein
MGKVILMVAALMAVLMLLLDAVAIRKSRLTALCVTEPEK